MWNRARAFLLRDAGEAARPVGRRRASGPTVRTAWQAAFARGSLSFFGRKDASPRQGHWSVAQAPALQAHGCDPAPRNPEQGRAPMLAH